MEKYKIKLNERIYEVEIEEISNNNTQSSESRNLEEKRTNNSNKTNNTPKKVQLQKDNAENITAPMPGDIVDIKVKEGQTVNKGEILLILEAMKMENEIVAPKDGTVCEINVNKGDSVNLGDNLILIQ